MQSAIERKPVAKAVVKPMTQADKELAAMKAYMKEVSRSKESATAFLEQTGVIDKNGRLAEQYRG